MIALHKKLWLVAVAVMMTATVTVARPVDVHERLLLGTIYINLLYYTYHGSYPLIEKIDFFKNHKNATRAGSLFLGLSACAALHYILKNTYNYLTKETLDTVLKDNIALGAGRSEEGAERSEEGAEKTLIEAVREDNIVLCKELLKKGADVNQQDSGGHTPLIAAVLLHNKEICELLLTSEKIDFNIKNQEGYSVLELSQKLLDLHEKMDKGKQPLTGAYLKIHSFKEIDKEIYDLLEARAILADYKLFGLTPETPFKDIKKTYISMVNPLRKKTVADPMTDEESTLCRQYDEAFKRIKKYVEKHNIKQSE